MNVPLRIRFLEWTDRWWDNRDDWFTRCFVLAFYYLGMLKGLMLLIDLLSELYLRLSR